ncbi:hypothetical protein NDR87_07495 [Nocardia sp. CDC159]|uniref:Uncharacterized protein n=1 Tax=Nocardia pulmonis TaxID=2951408 RepID=A0A9X2E383_9NOCA|nr:MULTISPECIES: hypothetical protein [Nocardia]MCM6773312.1 hypothetical protein [Nocardia pulmonis]MCM6786199.1 hypothetical protein [Nocardia sp. CDC159]
MPASNHVPDPTPSENPPLSRRDRRRKTTQPQPGNNFPTTKFASQGRAAVPAHKYLNYRRG